MNINELNENYADITTLIKKVDIVKEQTNGCFYVFELVLKHFNKDVVQGFIENYDKIKECTNPILLARYNTNITSYVKYYLTKLYLAYKFEVVYSSWFLESDIYTMFENSIPLTNYVYDKELNDVNHLLNELKERGR